MSKTRPDYEKKTVLLGSCQGTLEIPRSPSARWKLMQDCIQEAAGEIGMPFMVMARCWTGEAPWPARRQGQEARAWVDECLEVLQDQHGASLMDVFNVGHQVYQAVNGGRPLSKEEAKRTADFCAARVELS